MVARPHLLLALFTVFSVSFGTSALAQEAKPADPTAKPKINFQEHVQPIFREHCYTCHSADQSKGGLALDTFAATMKGGAGGEVVFAGDLDSSRLWALVAHLESPKMPPEQDKLPEAKLNAIKQWILEGALENAGSKVKVTKKPSMELKVSSGGSNKPVGAPAMPEGQLPEPVVVTKRPGAITAIATSPWAPLVAVSGQKQVLLYHAETFELLSVLPYPEGTPHVVKFSRNGSLLLVGGGRGGQAGKVVLFDVKTGKRVGEVGDELDVVLAADVNNDHTLVALGGPRKMIRIYSLEDGEVVAESRKHTDWIYSIEFSPDGVLLASSDRSGGLLVWESETGREFHNLIGHKAAITDVSWRIDSNVLASGSEDGTIKLWEMENGREIKSWPAHDNLGVLSVDFAPNGNLISTGRNKAVRHWAQDGKQLRSFDPFTDMGMEVAITFDNKRVVAGDLTGEVRVWNADDGKLLSKLLANPPTIAGLVDLEVANLASYEKAIVDTTAAKAAADQRLLAARAAVDAANKATEDVKRFESERAKFDQAVAQAQAKEKKATEVANKAKTDAATAQKAADEANKAAAAKAEALKQVKVKFDADKLVVEKAEKEAADLAKAAAAKTDALKALKAKPDADKAAVATAEKEATEATKQATAKADALKPIKAKFEADKALVAKAEKEAADSVKQAEPKVAAAKVAAGLITTTAAEQTKAAAERVAADKAKADMLAALDAAKKAIKPKAELDKMIASRGEIEKAANDAAAAVEAAKAQATATKSRLERAKQLKALQDKTRTAQASAK